MFQIKKIGLLKGIQVKYQFLLRAKKNDLHYTLRKKKSTVVYVRSPKHFNIGKQRIYSLNYKVYFSKIKMSRLISIKPFCCNYPILGMRIFKNLPQSHQFFVKSYKLTYSTKIKFF